MSEEIKKRIADLKAENKGLKEKLAKFEPESPVKAFQTEAKMLSEQQLALPDKLAELAEVKAKVAKLEEEKHLRLISEIVDIEIALSIIEPEDSQNRIERFKKFDDYNLTLIKQELERIIEKIVEKQGGLKLDRHMRLIH